MKKLVKIILLATVMLCGINPLYAGVGHNHSGHGHSHVSITKAEVERIAEEQIASLVYEGRLPRSWLKVDSLDAKKKQLKYSTEWLIRFQNTKIKDIKKEIIHVFVNLSGEVTGVNYTGK